MQTRGDSPPFLFGEACTDCKPRANNRPLRGWWGNPWGFESPLASLPKINLVEIVYWEWASTLPPKKEKGAALFLGSAWQPAIPLYQRMTTSLFINLMIRMMRMIRTASPMRRPRPSSAPAAARFVREASRCRSCALIASTLVFASSGDTP